MSKTINALGLGLVVVFGGLVSAAIHAAYFIALFS